MNLFDTTAVVEMLSQKRLLPGIVSNITLIQILREIDSKKRPRVKSLLQEIFSVQTIDEYVVDAYCNLYARLLKDGLSVPDQELMIASTAIAHDLTLETKDARFQKLVAYGLKLK